MTERNTEIHLVCGSTGAGKTTFSTNLSKEQNAAIFSIDEWMVAMFAPDIVSQPNWAWISERVLRCETQILRSAFQLADLGVPSILDFAFLQAGRRREVVDLVKEAGYRPVLHFLDVSAAERWRRVSARNAARGETFHHEVTRPMFDFIETIWEPPTDEELKQLGGMRV